MSGRYTVEQMEDKKRKSFGKGVLTGIALTIVAASGAYDLNPEPVMADLNGDGIDDVVRHGETWFRPHYAAGIDIGRTIGEGPDSIMDLVSLDWYLSTLEVSTFERDRIEKELWDKAADPFWYMPLGLRNQPEGNTDQQ